MRLIQTNEYMILLVQAIWMVVMDGWCHPTKKLANKSSVGVNLVDFLEYRLKPSLVCIYAAI